MVSVNDCLMGVNWGNDMPRMPARHYRHPQRKGKRHGAPGVPAAGCQLTTALSPGFLASRAYKAHLAAERQRLAGPPRPALAILADAAESEQAAQ